MIFIFECQVADATIVCQKMSIIANTVRSLHSAKKWQH
jgi:hypothetical protein